MGFQVHFEGHQGGGVVDAGCSVWCEEGSAMLKALSSNRLQVGEDPGSRVLDILEPALLLV